MKNAKSLRKAAFGLGLVCIIGASGALSMSYFTDHETQTNDFTTGGLNIKETETLWDNTSDGQNMYPGYTVNKNPKVQNVTGIADNPVYIKAEITLRDADGTKITNETRRNQIMKTLKYDSTVSTILEGTKYSKAVADTYPTVNPEFDFISYEAGTYKYYLKTPLASASTEDAGESKVLLNKVLIPLEWSQTELDIMGNYSVEVEFTAIQTKTFTDINDAMKALNSENIHEGYDK